jgi:hypothetical protein
MNKDRDIFNTTARKGTPIFGSLYLKYSVMETNRITGVPVNFVDHGQLLTKRVIAIPDNFPEETGIKNKTRHSQTSVTISSKTVMPDKTPLRHDGYNSE